MLKHYKGKKEFYSYNKNNVTEQEKHKHENGIYFTSDTHEVFMNGHSYGKDADTAKLGKDILISEGPLATTAIQNAFGGTISKDMTIADVLSKLLCKTKYPTLSYSKATISMTDPEITRNITTGPASGSVVEVGTPVSVTFTGGASQLSPSSNSVSGFNGYVLTTKDENQNIILPDTYTVLRDKTSFSESWSDVSLPVAGYTLTKTTPSGGLTNGDTSPKTSTNQTAITNLSYTFSGTVAEGYNSCSVTETTPQGTAVVPHDIEAGKFFVVANTGDISLDHINNKVTSTVGTPGQSHTIAAKTTSKSYTCTGAYPILFNGTSYTGAENDTPTYVNGVVVAESDTLVKSGDLWQGTKTIYVKFPQQNGHPWKIGIPNYYNATTITAHSYESLVDKNYTTELTFTKKAKLDSDNKVETDKEGNIIYVTGTGVCTTGTTYAYTVWECVGNEGSNGVKLTINLARQ